MMYVPAVFLPTRLEEIGITAPLLVAVYGVTLGAVTASAAGLAYARLRARFSHAAILRCAASCWLVAYLVYGTVSQPVVLLLAPALVGVGNSLAMPALTVLIADRAPEHLRGRATSLQGTAMFTGQFVSPLLAGPLIAATSHTVGFLAASGVAAAVLAAVLLTRVAAEPPAPAEAGRSSAAPDREDEG